MPEKREDVEATLQQSTTPDTSQQKEKWRAIDRIAGTTLATEVLMSFIWAILWVHECRFEHQLQVYFALVLIILTGGYFALIFCPIFKEDDDPRWFHARILSSGIVGGSYAFLLPVVMSLPEGSVTSGGAAALRQAILLATGGLIGLVALGETRRKNDNDLMATNELQIRHEETIKQQKNQFEEQIKEQQQQFEANAFKERKAERRERYTKAVEQLGSKEASVRMGGVYTLVGLVDEWLEEENLSENKRLKEGQVIINNLCAYIRSPFTLATRYSELKANSPTFNGVYEDNQQKFYKDKSEFKAEADVRLGIIKEIHSRLRGAKINTPGEWSNFEYDFSGSTFFYPVDFTESYYTKPVNFSRSSYHGRANFRGSTYQDEADFSSSTYHFFLTEFSGSTYQSWVTFSHSTYQGQTYFSHSTYQGRANFNGSTYQGRANFGNSIYKEKVIFSAPILRSTYQDKTDFSGSIFYQEVYFGEDRGNMIFSRFTGCAPQFYDETKRKNTLFGSHNNDFTVDTKKGYPINLNSKGLPLGCKFLTSEQKEYLEDKFQEIEETNNKILKVKDPKEKAELSEKSRDLNRLHIWREEATTVKMEDVAAEDTES